MSETETEVNPRVIWLARLGGLLLRALALTWRVRFANPEVVRTLKDMKQPFIYALWHGQLLPLIWAHRKRGIAIMVSEHSDGEIIARVAYAMGFRTVRGSTSRGGARALLRACQEIESGVVVAVTVDGPRGPAKVVAPGVVVIAQRTGAPMVPTAASTSRAWRLRSWDQFMIPKPFARVTVAYGEPIRVAADSPRDAISETGNVRAAIEHATELAGKA